MIANAVMIGALLVAVAWPSQALAADAVPVPPLPADCPVDAATWTAWHRDGSYYALLEIIDAYRWFPDRRSSTFTVTDVQAVLGQGQWAHWNPDLGPETGTLVYTSFRRAPFGSIAVFHFDDAGVITSLEWISE